MTHGGEGPKISSKSVTYYLNGPLIRLQTKNLTINIM
jgi:hypothetical protein